MERKDKVTVTEVQGLEATTLLDYFKSIETELKGLNAKLDNPQSQNELLTRQQVSKMLGISTPTLWTWTKKNILISYNIGNRVLYKKQEVLEALQRKATNTQ